MNRDASALLGFYSKEEWRLTGVLLVAYVAVYLAVAQYIPAEAGLNPASAIALCALFFGGVRLWPVVYIAALIGAFLTQGSELTLVVSPVAITLEASLGAYLLSAANVDPLFRRTRDMFYLISTIGLVSFIAPTLLLAASTFTNTSYTLTMWGQGYIAGVFCFLILAPFILRWFAKPRFSRPFLEILETVEVFILLIGLEFVFFIQDIETVLGVPLVLLLLIPLFIITLRLRPRFLTLALVVTSLFAVAGALIGGDTATLAERLFRSEIYIIAFAISFFIATSLEEERRVNKNLMHSQLATLQNVLARVSSESRAKNDFIAVLAHELRNPLAPVVSTIELMQLKTPRDQEEVAALELMAERMATVRRLLDNLLDVSRISEGKVVLKNDRVDLEAAIKSAVVSTNHHRKELHQRLIFKGHNKPLYIGGDSVQIEQIFSNLLTNASKYSYSGDTITVNVREENNFAKVEVVDPGVGLDVDVLENIFLPFHQLEQSERSQKGLGIGLALVRNFVEMHGGVVTAESGGIGQGSRFTVCLPLLPTYAPFVSEGGTTEAQIQTSFGKGRLRVLIVDDNDAAAGSMGRLLELQGCAVAYAYDGAQAIQKTLALQPDAVLLDVGLPDQDGYTVARALRKRGFNGNLIALTGYSLNEVREQAKEAGFDHFLVKPAGLADLRRVLPEL